MYIQISEYLNNILHLNLFLTKLKNWSFTMIASNLPAFSTTEAITSSAVFLGILYAEAY